MLMMKLLSDWVKQVIGSVTVTHLQVIHVDMQSSLFRKKVEGRPPQSQFWHRGAGILRSHCIALATSPCVIDLGGSINK